MPEPANPSMQEAAAPLRPISFGVPRVRVAHRADGTILVQPTTPLGDYPQRITDRLVHWARATPDSTFMAERNRNGGWRRVTYAEMLVTSRHIGSALAARGLSADRPLLILSGNSIDHALIAFGALYAGVPYCPVSPAYSLISKDYGKLNFLVKLLTPGLVFVDDAAQFADAITSNVPVDVEIAATAGAIMGRRVTPLADFLATPERADIDAIHDAIAPDSIAKFLLTSGSTGNPKAVVTTQRMLCANQVMIRETLAFLKDEPPVIVDWLPWNHTFGGSHNVGLTLYNGGAMYLDAGKPTPAGIHETIRNLREVSPTVYFNVPKGYESLLPHLRDDRALRDKFFAKLHAMFFSGAALAPHIWDGLDELSVRATGVRVPMLTGLGATETAPFFMSAAPQTSRSGHIGLPVLGSAAKLVPNNGKWEIRCKGPNVTPGYWREPNLTAKAFDAEGFYKLGDALKLAVEGDFDQGFDFDGRISEDFKLASGTWVSVGPLRARFIAACAPLVRDVVITGINRDEIAAIVILDADGCRAINPALTSDDIATAANDPAVRAAFQGRVTQFAGQATGSSNRVTRAALLDTPLSIDRGEVTDKGSINQRAVLENRITLIDALYAQPPDARVIVADAKG